MSVDPVTLEVVRNAIYSIAEEMRVIVMRTTRSTLLKEAADLSCALTDAQGHLIAQGRDIPIHLGIMAETVKEFLHWLDDTPLEPGDAYVTNALAVGGNHLPDVKIIKPIFFGGELVAFSVAMAHWPDVGGSVPGSYNTKAREIYEEGLQIPPLRLFSSRGVDRGVLELLLVNMRAREEREGDIYGQRAACEVAARRLEESLARYGVDTVRACFAKFLDESEARMRAGISAVPDGVYHGEDWMDHDGITDRTIRIAAKVTIRGEEAIFDFSGTDPQAEGPINCTSFIVRSSVYYVAKTLFGPDIPPNAGCYRPLQVIVPEGTVLNPHPGAPVVGGNHETSRRVVDAVYLALAEAVPDRVTAAGFGSGGVLIYAGQDYVYFEPNVGGLGAGVEWDGTNGIHTTIGNVMNSPIEALEATFPFRIERYELIPNTGGRGRHRGGLGLRRATRVLEGPGQLATMVERTVVEPYGLFGGEPGRLCRLRLHTDGTTRELTGKVNCTISANTIVEIETSGGGGYGPPAERSAELEEEDRRLGYVE